MKQDNWEALWSNCFILKDWGDSRLVIDTDDEGGAEIYALSLSRGKWILDKEDDSLYFTREEFEGLRRYFKEHA